MLIYALQAWVWTKAREEIHHGSTWLEKWNLWTVWRLSEEPIPYVCSVWFAEISCWWLQPPAEEDDEDLDSEEEDEIPHLDANNNGYPIFPPIGHMNLDKQKVVIRLFLQTIYRKCLLLLFFDSDKILMCVLSGNFTFNPTAKVP